MRPALVRRRQVWLPTVWGVLVLLLIGALAILLVGRNLYAFLALNRPVGARVLVVEGWMEPEELDQAVAAIRLGVYEHVVTAGGPINYWPGNRGPATYADRAAEYLRKFLPYVSITSVSTPYSAEERTFLSAVMVRDWAKQSGYAFDALDVFSAGAHARRSRLLYRLALGPNVRVGVLAARPLDYDPDRWWQTSIGARDILGQAIGLLWVKCFFWPRPTDSHEKRGNFGRGDDQFENTFVHLQLARSSMAGNWYQ